MCVFNTVLGEELLFRGYLLPRMAGVFGRYDWVANGVIFAAYHLHVRWAIPAALVDTLTSPAREALPQRADRHRRAQRAERRSSRSSCCAWCSDAARGESTGSCSSFLRRRPSPRAAAPPSVPRRRGGVPPRRHHGWFPRFQRVAEAPRSTLSSRSDLAICVPVVGDR